MTGLVVGGREIRVVRLPSKFCRIAWPRIVQPVAPVLDHLPLVLAALAAALAGRFVVVREFRNAPLLLFAPLLWIIRKRLVLNVNENIPHTGYRGVGAKAFQALTKLGFRFLIFDGRNALPALFARYGEFRVATPLFCVRDARREEVPAISRSPMLKVGLVGDFRRDKGGVEEAARAVATLRACRDVDVVIGCHNARAAEAFGKMGIQTQTTESQDRYERFIESCDAILILADPVRYEFRHSGILADAQTRRVPVICPNLPLIRSQVTAPIAVGVTYDSIESIPAAVDEVRKNLAAYRRSFGEFFAGRSARQVEAALGALRNA